MRGRFSDRLSDQASKGRHKSLRVDPAFSGLVIESLEEYAVLTMDTDLAISSWNHAAEHIFGYTEGEIIGTSVALLFTDADRKEGYPKREFDKALSEGRAKDERYHAAKGGRRFWSSGLSFPLKDAKGGVRGYVKIVRDESERKRKDDAFLETEERLRLAVEAAEMGTWDYTPSSRSLKLSEVCRKILGLALDSEVTYDLFLSRVHPEDRARLDETIAACVNGTSAACDVEYRVIRPDGSTRWLTMRAKVLEARPSDRKDVCPRLIGSLIDITERKHGEELRKRSDNQLRTIIDKLPGLVSYIDKSERFVFNNERHREWFGRSPEQLKGTLPSDLIGGERYKIYGPKIKEALSGKILSFDTEFAFKDRERFIHVDLVPDRDGDDVRGCFAFVNDITDSRRRAEELQCAVNERTEALQRSVADLESFSYTVSHDLRAPLRAIQGYAHFLRKRSQNYLDSDGLQLLERISNSSVRMDRLIQDLLVFGRLSREDYLMYAVDLDLIVAHILEQYPGFEGVHVTVNKPLGRVIGQDSLLTQALSNLMGNAAKFVSKDREPLIEIRTEKGVSGTLRLTVEDNGIGIPDEFKAKLFQPFQRLHAGGELEGTGIGLAIVKKAVERMGGTLGFDSQIGNGSRFWIELPEEP